ncbi:NADPH:quinone reductase [Nocardioides sp. YR527]|uniref:zinc-binding dehydrogenase n=1 Tax=Nocardioides sp. YR527 TaxID=1881028 RepID=UPI00088FED84|nr:zinc-binding dehydrogenase [Nocardioides sp. YR527]SDL32207.1 NADPH:quinone reductase [Nocardioides sp. YR527]
MNVTERLNAAPSIRSRVPDLMRAVLVREPGAPTTLAPEMVPVPVPAPGQLLVRVEATTVISSELASRAGVSTARLPLVLGNDFVGVVVEAPSAPTLVGNRVLGAYGGYGYTRDGAWAEYVVVDEVDAFPVRTDVSAVSIASVAGSFTAASGSLRSLGNLAGRTLLVRGGTSGVGLAVITLARDAGARILATTRDSTKVEALREHGADDVILDDDRLSERVREVVPGRADLAVELLGVAALPETLRCVHEYGVVCLTGLLRDQTNSIRTGVREDRSAPAFPHPMELIPPTVRLTVGGVDGTARTPELVRGWVDGLATGRYRMPVDSVFDLDDMAAAHERRGDPRAFGKVVISVSRDVGSTAGTEPSSDGRR